MPDETQECYLCVQRAFLTVRLQMSRDAFGEVFEEGAVEVDLGLSADVREHEDHLREAGIETRVRTKLLDDLVAVGENTKPLFSAIVLSFDLFLFQARSALKLILILKKHFEGRGSGQEVISNSTSKMDQHIF